MVESYQEYQAARSLLGEMARQNSNWGNPPDLDNLDLTEWQVGITDDLERRLKEHVKEHGVSAEKAVRVRTESHEMASKIEKYFHDAGAKGKGGGGNENSVIIYAFHK